MKVASDVMLNKIVQRVKTLISGKSNTDHTHSDYASSGAALTRETCVTVSGGYRSPTQKAMFYIVTIYGMISEVGSQPFTSVVVEWNICGYGNSVKIPYYLGEIFGWGTLTVQKDSAGKMTFSIAPNTELDAGDHYIRRVDGYM